MGGTVIAAFKDIFSSINRWPLIIMLGWRDTISAHRRALLGPVWLFLQTFIWVFFITFIFRNALGRGDPEYIVYVASGLVAFQMMSLIITDGTSTFIREASLIKNIPVPAAVYVFRIAARAFFTFWFEVPVVVGALVLIGFMPGWSGLAMSLAATLFTIFCFLGLALALASISILIRDVVPAVQMAMRVAFFATPIFWRADTTDAARILLSTWNPLAYFMSAIRNPLLGQSVELQTWIICAILGCVFWVTGLILFSIIRPRLAALV